MKFTGLIIMDGYGIAPLGADNAISGETSPNVFEMLAHEPSTQLKASGLAVGLPEGQMGNSEVGHLNIGAGRVIYQELTRITKAIEDGDFFANPALVKAMDAAKQGHKKLHVMGLVSDGGVHSHITHLFALADMAKRRGLDNVYIHCFMDGRDTPPESGKGYIEQLQAHLDKLAFGKIATISGRFYAMDRDNIWDRVQKAYEAIVEGEGVKETDPVDAMQHSYDNGVTDEFVIPTVLTDKDGAPVATVDEGDSVIFFNFRPDRARQITRAFIYPDFDSFPRRKGFLAPHYVSFTQYDVTFNDALDVAFRPESYTNTLGEYLAKNGIKQFRIAETQKYAHVTFFFNGGVEAPNEGEDRILIPSPKIKTFDMKPEMSAYEVADRAVKEIESGKYGVMILNFANCDMVGHTGVMSAAKQAVKVVDECVRKVTDAILSVGGQAFITADHGNCDHMFDADGTPFTAHTTNPVPFIAVGVDGIKGLADGGRLCDIAPTMLDAMGLPVPSEMTGHSLLLRD